MDYLEGFKSIVERAPAFRGLSVHLAIIANPVAGGFTIAKRADENRKAFSDVLEWALPNPVLTRSCAARLHLTSRAGHAHELAEAIIGEIMTGVDKADVTLIVTAGGDGTSHEVQTAIASRVLSGEYPGLAERLCVLRLPFGTGNDGSDGRHLSESLELLTSEVEITRNPVVLVRRAGTGETKYAFNIASVGLDAFVSDMTNRLKSKIPGDVYKLWIDVACLFYDRLYRVGEMDIRTSLGGEAGWGGRAQWLLALMGASGHRTYGSNQKILPTDENVCCIREMPLLEKLSLKELFKKGGHAGNAKAVLCKADRMVIGYNSKLLMQLDGETVHLGPEHFPVVMELSSPCMPILRLKRE